MYQLKILLVVLFLSIGCTSNNEEGQQDTVKSSAEFVIPSAINAAALPNGATLIAEIYRDYAGLSSVPSDTQNLTLPVTGNVQFSLTGIPVGDHTFTIIFKYTDDPLFTGTYELARATSGTVNIVKGNNPTFVFSAPYDTSADDDSDGVSNLTELDARSNPGDAVCVFGVSMIGNCTFDA